MQRGSLLSAGYIAYVLVLWFALGACDSSVPARTLLSVNPNVVSNLVETTVVVTGTGFLDIPVVSLGSRHAAALRTQYRVGVGDVFETAEVEKLSAQQLRFVLPAGLKPGRYDLEVTPPLGDLLRLPEALTVTQDVPDLTLDLETRADGAGEVIDERTLSLTDTLALFAVYRHPDGTFATADLPVHFSQQRTLGVLSDEYAAQTVFSPRLPGTLTLRAESDAGDHVEVSLHINDDPLHGLVADQLSLEDAPSGAGSRLDAEQNFTAGEKLRCYAVVRDSAGHYVLDVPVRWSVSGANSTPQSTASSMTLDLHEAGDVHIVATYAGLGDATLLVHIAPGRAAQLSLTPATAALRAGDAPLTFSVAAQDAFGNATQDVGGLSFAAADATFGDFDASSATLTPRKPGAGHVTVRSSYGVMASSGLVDVGAGPVDRLSVMPDTLQLSADDAPVQFKVVGADAFGNATTDVGDLTWTLVNGSIGTLSDLGVLDPTTAGTDLIEVTSSLGPSARSGMIEVTPGQVRSLNIQPQTWSATVGDAPQQFAVTGSDADGNVTTDVGTLTFSVASGPIGHMDPQSGLFSPLTAGQGTIGVVSSYGLTAMTQAIVISPKTASVRVAAIRAPRALWPGETAARVEVDVECTAPSEVVITGLGLSFVNDADATSAYTVVPDRANLDHIAPGVTQTLVFYVDVSSAASNFGTTTITAAGEAFPTSGEPFLFAGTTTASNRFSFWVPSVSLSAPKPPADRACAGGRVMFSASSGSLLSTSYAWSFSGGTLAAGSSLVDRSPSVDYPAVGNFPYSVAVTYFGFETAVRGTPVYVGTTAVQPADTYPTGHVVLASPAAGQSIALSSFPRSDLIVLEAALPVSQCDGTAVDESGHRSLTVFSDRALIDPVADTDSAAPGIQVQVTASGALGSLPLRAPARQLEGSSTFYVEHFEPGYGEVTAAGDVTFRLSGDAQAPSVLWSAPASDCTTACLSPGEPLIFQFSEPISTSSLSNARVELFSGTTCTGTPSADITADSERSYEAQAYAYYVTPAARSGAYAVRVSLPASITDNSAAKNALSALSRCAVFSDLGSLGSPAVAATPRLIAAPAVKFSPDGDQSADTLSWQLDVDAATSLLRVRITRDDAVVWAHLAAVVQAGPYTVVWDGADLGGRIVNNGAYGYSIEALNRAGVASAPLRGYVEVDSAVRMVSTRRRQ